MDPEYQAEHLAFVTTGQHGGAGVVEAALVGLPVHGSLLLLGALHQLLGWNYSSLLGRVGEWALLTVPTVLTLTVIPEAAASPQLLL